jgi:hypothetical protein
MYATQTTLSLPDGTQATLILSEPAPQQPQLPSDAGAAEYDSWLSSGAIEYASWCNAL